MEQPPRDSFWPELQKNGLSKRTSLDEAESGYYLALTELKDKITEIMDRAQVNSEVLAIQLEVTKDLIEKLYVTSR